MLLVDESPLEQRVVIAQGEAALSGTGIYFNLLGFGSFRVKA